jgi:cytochrome P450
MIDHEETQENLAEKSENKIDDTSTRDDLKWNNKNFKKTLTNKEILSQAFLFLGAGYDTTGLALSFMAYNLAKNPEYQTKLCEEVDQALENHVFAMKLSN